MTQNLDLGALIARLMPQIVAMEEPILKAAGLSMWEYAILTELARGDAVSQVELARKTGRDATRLGRHLDDLTARGIVGRQPATDHRKRLTKLTPQGRTQYLEVKNSIVHAEAQLLGSALTDAEADSLRELLQKLAGTR